MARKPKQQRSKATVDAIVQAALISIASHGPSAITARQIAEKAGIGVGSLYEYFEDKDAIIDAASKRFVSDTVDLIKPLIPELVRLDIREAIEIGHGGNVGQFQQLRMVHQVLGEQFHEGAVDR